MSRSRGLCAVCRRGTRGFGWFDARFAVGDPRRVESLRWFCSLMCQGICHRRRGMIDPTQHERAAMDHAVAMAGEYIESRGRTDLMTWSLADERFAGQISSARADSSGSAYIQLATVLRIYGTDEEGWDTYASIFENFALSESSGAVPRFVNDGEAAVGITLEDNAYLYVKGGGPVAIVYPEDGTSALADGMALVKGAANPEAGKAFIDWALSKETQELAVQELGRRPIRTDVAPSGDLTPMSEIELIDYDITWAAENRDEFMDKWNELLLTR